MERQERLRYLSQEAEASASQNKLTISEHCSALRYEVILTTESSIEHINRLSERLLEQIDAYEEELMSTYEQRNVDSKQDLSDLLKQTEELTRELDGLASTASSNAADLEAIKRKYEDQCKKLTNFRDDMYRRVYGGKYLRFIENPSFFDLKDHLGTLENVKSPRIQTALKAFGNGTKSLSHLVVTSKGQLVSASTDGKIRIWDTENSKMLVEINAHCGVVTSIIRLTSGELVSTGVDNTIKIWQETENGAYQHRLFIRLIPIHGQAVSCCAATSDGFLATGSFDGVLNIWHLVTGESLTRMLFHMPIKAIAGLPNGWVACSCEDMTIRVSDLRVMQGIGVLRGHSGQIYGLLVLNDGTLASSSFDRTVRIWDTIKGLLLRTLVGHTDFVRPLVQLKDDLLATGSIDTTIRVWDIKTGKPKRTLFGHRDAVSSLAILPNGKLASTSIDHMILLWDISV